MTPFEKQMVDKIYQTLVRQNKHRTELNRATEVTTCIVKPKRSITDQPSRVGDITIKTTPNKASIEHDKPIHFVPLPNLDLIDFNYNNSRQTENLSNNSHRSLDHKPTPQETPVLANEESPMSTKYRDNSKTEHISHPSQMDALKIIEQLSRDRAHNGSQTKHFEEISEDTP
jgi:hypothetical protein